MKRQVHPFAIVVLVVAAVVIGRNVLYTSEMVRLMQENATTAAPGPSAPSSPSATNRARPATPVTDAPESAPTVVTPRPTGTTYAERVATTAQGKGDAYFTGDLSFEENDLNEDKRIDEIYISVDLNVSLPGKYKVEGQVVDEQGKDITGLTAIEDLSPGANKAILELDCRTLVEHGARGPWKIKELKLMDLTRYKMPDEIKEIKLDRWTLASFDTPLPPKVFYTMPEIISSSGGERITVHGKNMFHITGAKINGVPVEGLETWSDAAFAFVTPRFSTPEFGFADLEIVTPWNTIHVRDKLRFEQAQDRPANENTTQKNVASESTQEEYKLGLQYLNGDGVKRDANKGLKHLQKAGDAGSGDALFMLGKLYKQGVIEEGRMVLQPNNIEAAKYFERAGEAGQVNAYSWLEALPEDARRAAKEDASMRHERGKK